MEVDRDGRVIMELGHNLQEIMEQDLIVSSAIERTSTVTENTLIILCTKSVVTGDSLGLPCL